MTTTEASNPLFTHGHHPRFTAITPESVREAIPSLLETASTEFDAFENSVEPTWEGIFARQRRILEPLGYAWQITSHLMGVLNSDALREVHEEMLPKVIEFYTKLGQSKPVYKALEALKNGEGWNQLSAAQQRILDKELIGMKLSGISLEGAEKERYNAMEKELAELSTGYSNAVLDSRKAFELIVTDKADTKGLPTTLLQIAAAAAAAKDHEGATAEDGPWRITLDAPILIPFLQHGQNRDQREIAFRAMITVASEGEFDNQDRIEQILTLRKEKAGLLGFNSHAEISVSTKMAEKVEAVDKLADDLRTAAFPKAKEELAELIAYARKSTGDENLELAHWDMPFWSERMREEQYDLSDEELRPYFPFPKVLDGLFAVTKRLFDVTVEAADGEEEVWHEDVRFFRIKDSSGKSIASFYLDPYSRPENKRGGAWMNNIIDRETLEDGTRRLPTAVLVCNQSPPTGDTPSLMTHREVETLFHEFGHGLQHMLTTVDLPEAAGINAVEWDAVELPSQFMENWTYHEATVKNFARHWKTEEPLPSQLFERLVAAKNFRAATGVMRQLYLGGLDMELHHRYEPGKGEKVADVKARIVGQMSVLPPLESDRFECAFSHRFAGGYSAGYYSYKWAEVLSADAFGAFEDAGLGDNEALAATGRKFRDTVLAQGGSRHPMEVFQDFRGRAPSTEALLRHTGLA
jgi:oligopeptidase A